MSIKTITEKYAVCSACGGGGRVTDYSQPSGTAGPIMAPCVRCGGVGQYLIERTITTEELATNVDAFVRRAIRLSLPSGRMTR